jgi:hypothetical protein
MAYFFRMRICGCDDGWFISKRGMRSGKEESGKEE